MSSVVESFFYNLIILENGKMKSIKDTDDIENILEKLTGMRDAVRNKNTSKSKKVKENLDTIIHFITNMASLAYISEQEGKALTDVEPYNNRDKNR